MADMNEFEDTEARLRRYRATAPSLDVREALLSRAPDVGLALKRRGLWRYAAAAALVLALNLGTEWWMSSRTRVGAAGPTQATAAPGTPMVLEALNGFAVHWRHVAVHWNGYPRTLASRLQQRQGLLKEFSQ